MTFSHREFYAVAPDGMRVAGGSLQNSGGGVIHCQEVSGSPEDICGPPRAQVFLNAAP
jgi:hypothetical protein